MRTYFLTLMLLFGLIIIGFAQQRPQGTPEERAKRTSEMMEKSLSLTADQKAKIYDASLERGKAIEALRTAADEGNRPDISLIKAANEKFEKVLVETLTAEQKVKFEEMRAKRGNGNKPKPDGGAN